MPASLAWKRKAEPALERAGPWPCVVFRMEVPSALRFHARLEWAARLIAGRRYSTMRVEKNMTNGSTGEGRRRGPFRGGTGSAAKRRAIGGALGMLLFLPGLVWAGRAVAGESAAFITRGQLEKVALNSVTDPPMVEG